MLLLELATHRGAEIESVSDSNLPTTILGGTLAVEHANREISAKMSPLAQSQFPIRFVKRDHMGGFNSGRPRTRMMVEDCLPLDASFLRKLNCFKSGSLRRERLTWCCDDKVSAEGWIEVVIFPKQRPRAMVTVDGFTPQTIWLTSTRPNHGGKRWWFLCPILGRRCRTLHMRPDANGFVSRDAARIVYRSNTLGPADRIRWRAQQLRGSLPGAKCGAYPPRPKGMHHTTYHKRLRRLRDYDGKVTELWHSFLGRWAEHRRPSSSIEA